jgi:hypothetical protein
MTPTTGTGLDLLRARMATAIAAWSQMTELEQALDNPQAIGD